MSTIEIPAHVRHENFVENKITVLGGTNWDLSRSAVETPITAIPDPIPAPVVVSIPTPPGYAPSHEMPTSGAALSFAFKENSVILSKQDVAEMKALPKKSRVLVAGHADAAEKTPVKLAQRRAQAVATQLKRQGHKVVQTRSFGTEVPKTFNSDESGLNRRVEVFEK